jgi:hypothetical protein
MICPGSKVRFKAHGETGLLHTVVTREGDDCQLHDERNRALMSVPVELLVEAGEPTRLWREPDELEAG